MTSTLLQQAVEALTRASSGLSYYRTVKHDDSFLVGVAADLHAAKSLIEQHEQESALQQQPEPVAWRPIESAPKDGEHVLLALAEGYIGIGYYDNEVGFPARWIVFGSGEKRPTHWMCLPQPPKGGR